jgi:dipeptidyl-peptidase 4
MLRQLVLAVLAVSLAMPAFSQDGPRNSANWKLAERFTTANLRPYLYSATVSPNWINESDRFWYVWRDSKGQRFWLVDPKKKTKAPLFDSAKMAALLSEVGLKPVDTDTLNVTGLTFDAKNEDLVRFVHDGQRYEYDRKKETLKKLTGRPPAETPPTPPGLTGRTGGGGFGFGGGGGGGQGQGQAREFRNFSPDKTAFVYAMEHNLYYVEVKDGKEGEPIQLTKDGEKDYSFGARQEQGQQEQEQDEQQQQGQGQRQDPNEKRVRASVTWSKDSKRFFVTRGDSRKVKDLFLVNSLSQPRPTLMTYKYAMPGETEVTQTELFVFDPEKKELVRCKVEKYKDQRLLDIHFQDASSDVLRLVRRDRLQRNLELIDLDLKTNEAKILLTEKVENAFLETQSIRYVAAGGDFLWFSERNGWGHLYLYTNDGKLKHAVTSGPWRAHQVVAVDGEKGQVWFQGKGREDGENPYFTHLYRIGLDGKGLTLLDPGDGDHSSALSPSREFHLDSVSRIDLPNQNTVRDRDGKVVMELESMDVSRLMEAGWRMPEPFKVKAADGVTDIYGNMWKPTDFDPARRYPIIANVYPGPQTESVTSTFSATATNQRLAQLGFIVIQIGNRGGNPARSNAYHSFGYFNLRDYGLADKKAGIEQLAQRHPWIDVDRVGIYGHSGGGFMTAAALLLPPYNEFFTVGVSSAGNHDNNIYNQNWSEQHHGLRERSATTQGAGTGRTQSPDPEVDGLEEHWFAPQEQTGGKGDFEIKVPTNHELAANLKGHLLLVHGDMDNNVHPGGTIRLVDALIKANKRFDFMLMPGQAHGFGNMQEYFTQMLMEYFAEHLLGDYYRGSPEMRDKSGG